jgi:hypothetical protein
MCENSFGLVFLMRSYSSEGVNALIYRALGFF